MKSIFSRLCRGQKSKCLIKPARIVYHDHLEEAEDLEMEDTGLKGLDVGPSQKARKIAALQNAYSQLEEIISSVDQNKYKDVITMARARLDALKRYVPQSKGAQPEVQDGLDRMTEEQLANIVSSLRLSIVSAKTSQAREKMAGVERAIEAQKELKLKKFKDVYDRISKEYKGWPKVLAAVDKSFKIRMNAVKGKYTEYLAGTRGLLTGALGRLGPDIKQVLQEFNDLDEAFAKVSEEDIPKWAGETDNLIMLDNFEVASKALYENEKEPLLTVVRNDFIEFGKFALEHWGVLHSETAQGSDVDYNNAESSIRRTGEMLSGTLQLCKKEGNHTYADLSKEVSSAHDAYVKDLSVYSKLLGSLNDSVVQAEGSRKSKKA
jgi:hypothetical protein